MALSTIVVKIQGDASGLAVALKTAGVEVVTFQGKVGGADKAATTLARGLSNLGRGFTNAAGQSGVLNSEISILASSVGNVGLAAAAAGIGLGALVGGIAASIAASINFETAITRVGKTANLSAEQTKEFGDEILDMSRRLPVATSALTDIAVVAGQLGITGTSNIASFVEEIAKLQSTTGVGATELATALGTILQVSNEPASRLRNISSALTELGNTSNSTEQQILDFSTRLVGLTSALGVTTEQLFGISSAFAAAGVDAERGATAIQRIFVALDTASQAGGSDLALIAQVAGLTVEQFKALEEANPAEAFAKFVEGLKGVKNVVPVLEELGIADQRLISAVLSVANSSSTLTDSLNTATKAGQDATATNEEFGRSSETTAAKLQLLKNNLNATAIEIGNTLTPAIRELLDTINGGFPVAAEQVNALADAFSGLADKISTVADKIPGLLEKLQIPAPHGGGLDHLSEAFDKITTAWDHIPNKLKDIIEVGFAPVPRPSAVTDLFGLGGGGGAGLPKVPANNPNSLLGADKLKTDMQQLADGNIKLFKSQGLWNDETQKTINLQKGLKDAAAAALKEFDKIDPITEGLKVQLAVLTQRKAVLEARGDTAGADKLENQIRGVNNLLQQQQAIQEGLNSVVTLYVAELGSATGDTLAAQAAGTSLANVIESLPEETKLEILTELPLDDMNKMLQWLSLLKAGVSVPVIIDLVSGGGLDVVKQKIKDTGTGAPFLPEIIAAAELPTVPESQTNLGIGSSGGSSNAPFISSGGGGAAAAKELSEDEKALLALSAAFATFHQATGGSLEDFRAVTKYFADAAGQTQRLSDAVVEYKTATIEAADATFQSNEVLIKVTEDKIDLERRQADLTVQLRAKAIEAADATFTLRQGLVAIAEHLLETGQTIEQFILETSTSALEGFKSAFDAIFNRPTQETAQLNLRKDELERNRLLLIRGGAVASGEHEDPRIKALDAQIDAINQELAIRQKDIDIMKDHAIIADKTNLTDADQATQAALLTTAIKNMSGQVQESTGIVYLKMTNLGNAANETADKLRSIGAIPARASGGAASGLTLVGEQGPELVRLPTGSHVFSNAQSRAMTAGEGGNNTFNVISYITADSKASQESMQELADMVDSRVAARLRLSGFAAGSVNRNSYAPVGGR